MLSEKETLIDVVGLNFIPVLIDNDFLISSTPVFKPTSGAYSSPCESENPSL
jgi:hypothetical protein